VLPARGTRGLPVVAVNVKEVDVEFLRVRDKELSNFFAAYQRSGKRSAWDLDDERGYWGRKGKPLAAIADSVYSNRFVLEGKQNQRTLSYLPIQNISELSEPGLYFAVMKRAGTFHDQFETSFFFVSDIGLHTRLYHDKLWLHTASLKSGDAQSGVDVQILDSSGDAVATAKTDGDGNALIAYELKSDHVLVARNGKDVSILPFNQPALDLSDFQVAGRKQEWFDVFAWSGRDLYRPGETLRLSALLRNFDGKPIKPQPLTATLKQPDGRVYDTVTLQPKELGYIEWTRVVPEDAPTGRWQVEFRLDPAAKEAAQSYTFRVEEFLPERLKLALDFQAGRDQTRRSVEPRCRRGLSVWGARRRQSIHRAADAGRRSASDRRAQGLLLRRSDHRPAEKSRRRDRREARRARQARKRSADPARCQTGRRRSRRCSPAASMKAADAQSRAP
jgi:uncharacterized protein YfaS (alpha-2-macroglobulin family)